MIISKKAVLVGIFMGSILYAQPTTEVCGSDRREAMIKLQMQAIEATKGIQIDTEMDRLSCGCGTSKSKFKSTQKLNGYRDINITKEYEKNGDVCLEAIVEK